LTSDEAWIRNLRSAYPEDERVVSVQLFL